MKLIVSCFVLVSFGMELFGMELILSCFVLVPFGMELIMLFWFSCCIDLFVFVWHGIGYVVLVSVWHCVFCCRSTMRKLPASASWKVSWKITETLNGEFIKTTLLRNADNQVTGIHRSKILMKQQRTRRWNIPLHRQRREVKAQKTSQAEATERYRHQMETFFRMSPGGFDAVLRESECWPELPGWFKRCSQPVGLMSLTSSQPVGLMSLKVHSPYRILQMLPTIEMLHDLCSCSLLHIDHWVI